MEYPKTLLDLREGDEIADTPIWGDFEDAADMAVAYLQLALVDEAKPLDTNRLRAAVALLNYRAAHL